MALMMSRNSLQSQKLSSNTAMYSFMQGSTPAGTLARHTASAYQGSLHQLPHNHVHTVRRKARRDRARLRSDSISTFSPSYLPCLPCLIFAACILLICYINAVAERAGRPEAALTRSRRDPIMRHAQYFSIYTDFIATTV